MIAMEFFGANILSTQSKTMNKAVAYTIKPILFNYGLLYVYTTYMILLNGTVASIHFNNNKPFGRFSKAFSMFCNHVHILTSRIYLIYYLENYKMFLLIS